MNNELAHYAAQAMRDDMIRASTHPSRLMLHEQRYARGPKRRRFFKRRS